MILHLLHTNFLSPCISGIPCTTAVGVIQLLYHWNVKRNILLLFFLRYLYWHGSHGEHHQAGDQGQEGEGDGWRTNGDGRRGFNNFFRRLNLDDKMLLISVCICSIVLLFSQYKYITILRQYINVWLVY